MSKSIYEEAREYARILKALPTSMRMNQMLVFIERTLEQAQKQEKLLELYRELMTVKDELISIAWFDDEDKEMEEKEAYLEKQIKELENE